MGVPYWQNIVSLCPEIIRFDYVKWIELAWESVQQRTFEATGTFRFPESMGSLDKWNKAKGKVLVLN
jgi:hypothetical protein